jgi:hypothetical protein
VNRPPLEVADYSAPPGRPTCRHFVSIYRAVPGNELTEFLGRAGFTNVRWLMPGRQRFLSSPWCYVMDAVERAASTPPPIPFPWKYAICGLAASLIAILSFVSLGFRRLDVGSTGSAASMIAPMLGAIIEGLKAIDAGWIAVSLLVTAASVFLSLRISRGRV